MVMRLYHEIDRLTAIKQLLYDVIIQNTLESMGMEQAANGSATKIENANLISSIIWNRRNTRMPLSIVIRTCQRLTALNAI